MLRCGRNRLTGVMFLGVVRLTHNDESDSVLTLFSDDGYSGDFGHEY